jgi:AcrR family transcriptional regulator
VLEAAEKLFAQKGYEATSVQEIAAEAEFSVGTLYKMFDGKEALYHRLVEMRAQEYFGEVEARMEAADGPVEQVRVALEAKLKFFESRRQFFRIFSKFIVAGRSAHTVLVSPSLSERYAEHQGHLAGVVEDGVERGLFAPHNPKLVAMILEGMTNAIIGRWVHTGETDLEEVASGELEDIVFRGLMAEEQDNGG